MGGNEGGRISEETKKVCSDFAENWSVTGFRYAYFDRGIRKLIWLILLLAATGFSTYLFYDAIVEYLERFTYNVDSMDYDVDSLDFPTITICNNNAINIRKAKANDLVKSIPQFQKMYNGLIGSKADSSEVNVKWFTRHNITSAKDAFHVFAPTYSDMTDDEVVAKILPHGACEFRSSACNSSDIKETLSWGNNGLCAEFNSYNPNGESKTVHNAGMKNGLKMMFNIDASNLGINRFDFEGLELLIHPYGTTHLVNEYAEIIHLQAGTMNIITIESKKMTYLPEPYSTKCVESAPYSIIENYPYSKAMCEIDCVLKQVFEKCNCVGFEFEGIVGDTPICDITQVECYVKYKDEYMNARTTGCKRTCSLECEATKYIIRTEQATVGNNDIYERINRIEGWNKTKQETAFYIQENIVGLLIGFKSIVERTSTVTASVTWTSLLGEIGGNLGLCMGLSILTAFELFFFVFDVLRSLRRKEPTDQNVGDVILK